MRIINLILLIMIIVSCKPVGSTSSQSKTLESMVAEILGEDAIIEKNKDSRFALCIKENLSTLSVSYMIVRLNDLVIVEQDNISRASFSWIDSYKIEVKFTPGIIRKDEQTIPAKVIDVSKYIAKL